MTAIRGASWRPIPRHILLLALIGWLSACQHMAPYSEQAYQQATSLKVESLQLMNEATEPYNEHVQEARRLQTMLQKAYEYAAGRPDNELSTQQWAIMKDPNRNLLGGFLRRWREEGKLSKGFIREAKGLVSDAYDTIIGLESGKIKPQEIQN